jgi:hypothetical protein
MFGQERLSEFRKNVQTDALVGSDAQSAEAQVPDIAHSQDCFFPQPQHPRGMVV